MPRRHLGTMWIVATALAAALPHAMRAAVLAATAGTLFEAIPFVLGVASLPRGRVLRFVELLGCGCGRTGPGALAVPALGICWLAFGPLVACARAVAALVLAGALRTARRRQGCRPNAPVTERCAETDSAARGDPLAELASLAPTAFAGALLAEALRALPLACLPPPLLALIGGVGGLLLGALLPCATGAVAVAAALRDIAPAATLAILATAGIVRIGFPLSTAPRHAAPLPATGSCHPAGPSRHGGERVAFALLALACGLIAAHGPSGFVNPRFVLPLGLSALGAVAFAIRLGARAPTMAPFPAMIPALLVAVTLGGSPIPERPVLATTLDDAYPGEALEFVGAVAAGRPGAVDATQRSRATLVRYTITCCRIDAEPRAVRLDRRLAAPVGTWYDARGTLALDRDGAFTLRVATLRPIAPPTDPFAYR